MGQILVHLTICIYYTVDVINKWYAAIYEDKKGKSHLYVGKALVRFLEDGRAPIESLQLDCLKPHVGSGTLLETYTDWQDVAIFPIRNIISRPLVMNVIRHDKLDFPEYPDVKLLYEKVICLDRKKLALQINSRFVLNNKAD